jgi:hypothetical protein
MRGMRIALVILAVTFGLQSVAYPCKCAEPALGDAVKRADAAFVGTITGVDKQATCRYPNHPDWCTHSYTYTIAVEGVWKGTVPAKVTLSTGSGTGDCSMGSLGSQKRWVFVANVRTGGKLAVRMCGGTRVATPATVAAMTKAYGAPKPAVTAP